MSIAQQLNIWLVIAAQEVTFSLLQSALQLQVMRASIYSVCAPFSLLFAFSFLWPSPFFCSIYLFLGCFVPWICGFLKFGLFPC